MEPEITPSPVSVKEIVVTHNKTRYVFLGILILIITAGIVSWTELVNQPKQDLQNLTVSNRVVGWQTYTNTKYGFELQYPSDWKIEQENELMCEDSGCPGENAVTISPGQPGVWVEIDDYGGAVHDWTSTNYGDYSVTNKVLHEKNLYLDIEIFDDTRNKESYMKELDQILSTFKFIEPVATTTVDTTNWKTYVNTEYGFEFKYPNWSLGNGHANVGDTKDLLSLEKIGPEQSTEGGGSFDDGAIINVRITGTSGLVEDWAGVNKIATSSLAHWLELQYSGIGGDKVDNLPITINGFTGIVRAAYRQTDFAVPWGEEGGAYKILPNGQAVIISWSRENLYSNDFSYQKYFLPILSTFKFTK